VDSAKEPKYSCMCRLELSKHFWQSRITADAYWLWLVQMAQNQTIISAGAKEGSAVISVPEDVSGLLMSGDHSKFNMLANQHNLSLGPPQGDHLNLPARLPMSSHSGENTPKILFLFIQRIWQLCVEKGCLQIAWYIMAWVLPRLQISSVLIFLLLLDISSDYKDPIPPCIN
jgi:hypothetical protein